MSFLLVLTNSSLNPILYGLKMKKFRKAFMLIINCTREQEREEHLTEQGGLSNGNPSSEQTRETVVSKEAVVMHVAGQHNRSSFGKVA